MEGGGTGPASHGQGVWKSDTVHLVGGGYKKKKEDEEDKGGGGNKLLQSPLRAYPQ